VQPDGRIEASRHGLAIAAAPPHLNGVTLARKACDVLSGAAIASAPAGRLRQRAGGDAAEDDQGNSPQQ
jgi:hypothetical protein